MIEQNTRRCWVHHQPNGDHEFQTHFASEAEARRFSDGHDGPVQLDEPCWVAHCDDCGGPLGDHLDEFDDYHWLSQGEAEQVASGSPSGLCEGCEPAALAGSADDTREAAP